jgi:two-component system phosphate regulon sensor histidine kinase PhoR
VFSLRARLFASMLVLIALAVGATLAASERLGDERGLFFGGVLGVLAAAAISEYFARQVANPIREMRDATDAIRRGESASRVRSQRQDELGALGGAIDQMADQLVERYEAVRREEGRLRTILDAMVEAVLVTDREGRVVLTNRALTRLAGDYVLGRTAVEAIRSPELHEAVQRAIQGKARAVELDVELGPERRFVTAHVARLPKMQGVVAVLHDVTPLKRTDAVRRDFVANASHELRTPLTAIKGFAETLLDGALKDERASRRFVEKIVHHAERLHGIVEDLLELSRAESPESHMELAPVDVAHTAARALSALTQRATEKRHQLVLEGAAPLVRARADERALDHVLLNLLDNAIKYTPARGRVLLRVRREGDRVVIDVSDNGPGIPQAHLDRIFERFYRVDKGRAREQGGTGLGLSIVRHLVQRMDGRVWVESRAGKGATFHVSLLAL